MTVCVGANYLPYPSAAGLLWVYVNWALGLRSLGCKVYWLECVHPDVTNDVLARRLGLLKTQLAEVGLDKTVALCSWDDGNISALPAARECFDIDAAAESDLFINIGYDGFPHDVIARFRRSVLVDIDPGLTQLWIDAGTMRLHPHDGYFSIGETVGQPDALFPSCGVRWMHTPPPIALDHWQPVSADAGAPYTTVTNWWGPPVGADGHEYDNGKSAGFLPFLGLPSMTTARLQLAIYCRADHQDDLSRLRSNGWEVCDALTVAATPDRYRRFVQQSRGEFSCAKPAYVRLETAWVSDRTLAYLASGKPAIVQHTGRSRLLPDAEGMFRFRTAEEAAHALDAVEADYERHCRAARALAEEHFDARKVVGRVLERAMDVRPSAQAMAGRLS